MKKILFIVTIVLLIFLVACAPFTTRRTSSSTEFRRGTQGLVMSFEKDSPPSSTLENSLFSITLDIENKGASDITNGLLSILYEEQYIDLNEDFRRFQLRGKESGVGIGQQDRIILRAKTRLLDSQIERFSSTITAIACYDYETIATAQVCIDTDIYNRVTTKPCTARAIGLSGGQGAPIAIKSVEPKMLIHSDKNKVEPRFIISLSNIGGGQIFSQGLIEGACGLTNLPSDAWNKITLSASLIDRPLECSTSSIKFVNNQAKVICSLPKGIDINRGTFTSPLKIELQYGYTFSISDKVEITRQI